MEDTPKHIKQLQLEIWLSKSLEERLAIALKTNEEWYLAMKEMKENFKQSTARSKMG